MSRFVHYLKDSQRGHRPILVFSFKKPSLFQAKLKQKWFFEPYRSKRISRWSKYSKFVELWFHYGYPFFSIFIDVGVLRDRYIRLMRAWDLYYDWVFTRSRWYKFWDSKIKHHALPILGGIGFYIVIQGFYIFSPTFVGWYKKKVWWVFINFIWFKFIKNFLVFSFFYLFILSKVIYFSILFLFCFLILFVFFYFLKRLTLVILYLKGSVFDRALLVSNFLNWKYCFKSSSRSTREIYKLGWRLSSRLSSRFSIILERFEEYQFPFSRQDDSIFLDFVGVKGSGWLKFESPISRLDFYDSNLPSFLFRRKKRRKWFSLALPVRFLSVWSKRPKRRFDKFYARNFILYTRWGESLLLKSRINHYNSFFCSFLANYSNNLFLNQLNLIQPLVLRFYPWWVYRQKFLFFIYVRFIFLYYFTFYKNSAPVLGDLVRVYRKRFRRTFHPIRMFYSATTYFVTFFNSNLRRLDKFWTETIFFSNSPLYNNFWLKMTLFLGSFSWAILLPFTRRIKRKKNNLFLISFFLTFIFLILIF